MSTAEFILAFAAIVCADLYWRERKRRLRAERAELEARGDWITGERRTE
jgi:hypothetical protein